MKRNLGNSVELWPQNIMAYVQSDYPLIAKYIQGIQFKTVDSNTGDGIGGLVLFNPSTGISAVVPLIIKDFSLDQMEIFTIDDDTYLPLTDSRLIEHMGIKGGELVMKSTTPARLSSTVSPPNHGEDTKRASLLEAGLSKTAMNPGLLKMIVDQMKAKEDGLVASRINNVLKKLDHSAVRIRIHPETHKWTATTYSTLDGEDKVEGRDNILTRFSHLDANLQTEVERNDEVYLLNKVKSPLILNDYIYKPDVLAEACKAAVLSSGLEALTGHFTPKVTSLDGYELDINLWFNGKKFAISSNPMYGYNLRESAAERSQKVVSGFFTLCKVFDDAAIEYIEPFSIIKALPPKEGADSLVLEIRTRLGLEGNIVYSKNVSSIIKTVEDGSPVYYVPTSYRLCEVGSEQITLYANLDDNFLEVMLGQKAESKTVRVDYLQEETSYKFSHLKNLRSPREAKWELIKLCLSEGDAMNVLNRSKLETIYLGNIDEKAKMPDIHIEDSLVQLAEQGVLPDDSLDSLLGLGFLEELDVIESLDYIQDFRSLESVLAKLLFQIRIGVNIATEETVSRALTYMSRLIDELEASREGLNVEKKT